MVKGSDHSFYIIKLIFRLVIKRLPSGSKFSIYIKFDQKKVDDANRRVIDYLFGKEKAGE